MIRRIMFWRSLLCASADRRAAWTRVRSRAEENIRFRISSVGAFVRHSAKVSMFEVRKLREPVSRVFIGAIFVATLLTAAHALASNLEEDDPVRNAQRMKDCIAQNTALKDGRSKHLIQRACVRAISDGTFKDPNISLDGMIKEK